MSKPQTTKPTAKLAQSQPTKQQTVLDQLKASVGVATKQSKKSKQSVEKQPSDAAKQPSKREKSEPKTVMLADVARELQLDPKIARARCRRNLDKLTAAVGKTLNEDGWVFNAAQKAKLVAFLTS